MVSRAALLTWSHLHVLDRRRLLAIEEVFGDLEKALGVLSESFLRELGLTEEAARNALLRLESFETAQYEQQLEKRGIRLIFIDDPAYPTLLRQIADPPVFLSVIGDLLCLDQPTIGIVGTRGMTAYGKRAVDAFVEPLVRAGLVTVSGLAHGIDTRVAEETLRVGGRTAACLGHGLHMIFPANNEAIARDIVAQGGLLVSEFPLSYEASTITFPARNRVIAGLSRGVIVIEAPHKSGALITAKLALDYGRDAFAVPGSIFDDNVAGSHALIASGQAQLVSTAEDVLRALGIVASTADASPAYEPESEDERRVLSALTTMPQPADDVVRKAGMSAARVNVALTMLELAGAARNVGGAQWVRL